MERKQGAAASRECVLPPWARAKPSFTRLEFAVAKRKGKLSISRVLGRKGGNVASPTSLLGAQHPVKPQLLSSARSSPILGMLPTNILGVFTLATTLHHLGPQRFGQKAQAKALIFTDEAEAWGVGATLSHPAGHGRLELQPSDCIQPLYDAAASPQHQSPSLCVPAPGLSKLGKWAPPRVAGLLFHPLILAFRYL